MRPNTIRILIVLSFCLPVYCFAAQDQDQDKTATDLTAVVELIHDHKSHIEKFFIRTGIEGANYAAQKAGAEYIAKYKETAEAFDTYRNAFSWTGAAIDGASLGLTIFRVTKEIQELVNKYETLIADYQKWIDEERGGKLTLSDMWLVHIMASSLKQLLEEGIRGAKIIAAVFIAVEYGVELTAKQISLMFTDLTDVTNEVARIIRQSYWNARMYVNSQMGNLRKRYYPPTMRIVVRRTVKERSERLNTQFAGLRH